MTFIVGGWKENIKTMEIENFLGEYQSIVSEDTRKAYRGYLQRFEIFLGEIGTPMEAMQSCDIKRFSQWLQTLHNFKSGAEGLSDSTVQGHLAAVSAFYRWRQCYDDEQRNPAAEFKYHRTKPPKEIKPIEKALASAMCRRSNSNRDIAIVDLFRFSGVRLAELVAMDKDSIRIDQGIKSGTSPCGIAKVLGKGRIWRDVLVGEIALGSIADYLDERGEDKDPAMFLSSRHRRISKRTVQRVIHRMAIKAGAAHAHPHQLRHSFGTVMNNAGLPEKTLQKRMGHARLETTFKYLKISHVIIETQYNEAMRKIVDGPGPTR